MGNMQVQKAVRNLSQRIWSGVFKRGTSHNVSVPVLRTTGNYVSLTYLAAGLIYG